MHAQLNARPLAQRDRPTPHIRIVRGQGGGVSGMLVCDASDSREIPFAGAGSAGGDGNATDQRPAAGDII
jgi:hypothetical protein